MVRPAGGVPKDQRKRALLGVLARRGRLNLDQIAQALEANLDIVLTSDRRTLYRDLEELVLEGELIEHRFAPDGTSIEEYDPTKHKRTYCEWTLKDEISGIKGGRALEVEGGGLLCSQRIQNEISLVPARETKQNLKAISVYFSLGHEYYSLNLGLDGLPYVLLFARAEKRKKNNDILMPLENEFGKRVVLVQLRLATLSALKPDKNNTGHCVFQFSEPGLCTLTDQNSRNGTYVENISDDEAARFVKEAQSVGTYTVNPGESNFLYPHRKLKKLHPGAVELVKFPVLISLSELFRIFII